MNEAIMPYDNGIDPHDGIKREVYAEREKAVNWDEAPDWANGYVSFHHLFGLGQVSRWVNKETAYTESAPDYFNIMQTEAVQIVRPQ